jgi:hypothetical protein
MLFWNLLICLFLSVFWYQLPGFWFDEVIEDINWSCAYFAIWQVTSLVGFLLIYSHLEFLKFPKQETVNFCLSCVNVLICMFRRKFQYTLKYLVQVYFGCKLVLQSLLVANLCVNVIAYSCVDRTIFWWNNYS